MNIAEILTAQDAINQTEGRILLVNPPVVDSRYEWIRWNQPLDLLKLGTLLKKEISCDVKLFDFMLPTSQGNVPRQRSRISFDLPIDEQIHWQFGHSWETFDTFLKGLINNNWNPDSVWITTLTSFWWQTVPLIIDRIKNLLKRPIIVLFGNYPYFELKHAAQFCSNADVIVSDHLDLSSVVADFSLYGQYKLGFCALDIFSPNPIGEISNALERGVFHFVFFNDNIFQEFDTRLKIILNEVLRKDWRLWFHGICGVEIRDFPINHAKLLAKANFSELHFEPALSNGVADELLYKAVMEACEKAGFVQKRGAGWESHSHYISAFLWICRPEDNLEQLVWNALKLLQIVGMIIPKPFSPTPGSKEYSLLESQINYIEPQDISPHRLTFAGLNGISKRDYQDLYRMTAFLNMKIRSSTFDFLGDSFLAKNIRESLLGRKWDIPIIKDKYG